MLVEKNNAISKYKIDSSRIGGAQIQGIRNIKFKSVCAYLFGKRWPYYAEVKIDGMNFDSFFREILILASLVSFHSSNPVFSVFAHSLI